MPHAIDAPRPARGGPRLRRLGRPRHLPAPPVRAAARRPVRSPAPLRPALVRAALAALPAALVLVAAMPAVRRRDAGGPPRARVARARRRDVRRDPRGARRLRARLRRALVRPRLPPAFL